MPVCPSSCPTATPWLTHATRHEFELGERSSNTDEHGDDVSGIGTSLCALVSCRDDADGDGDDLLVFGVEYG
jgi:hypothetical protein